MRRGFTLIELSLAIAMSSVILVAALGAFASLGRSHRELGNRFRQNAEMERTRVVVKRAIESLVVAKENVLPPGAGGAGAPAQGGSVIDTYARPSFFLSHEIDATSEMPEPRAAMKAVDDVRKPQRFECTLSRPLISSVSEEADERRRKEQGADVLARHADLGQQGSASLTRGVFEMVPSRVASGAPTGHWDLAWRPIKAAVIEGIPSYVPAEDHEVVVLLRGARAIRWLAFQDSKMKAEYVTSAMVDLPAYVVLEIEMPSGLAAQWMFEIGITVAPEFDEAALSPTPTDEGEGGEVGTPGAPLPNAPEVPGRRSRSRSGPSPAVPSRGNDGGGAR